MKQQNVIKNVENLEMKKQIIKFLFISEIVKKLNDLSIEDKKYYLEILIISVLHNTLKNNDEVVDFLENLKDAYVNGMILREI